MFRLAIISLGLCFSSLAYGLDCVDGVDVRVSGQIGVDVKRQDPSTYGTITPTYSDLLLVQIAWLPKDNPERDQEFITIDWPSGTTSQVDLWNGELQGTSEYGIRGAELGPNTNFDTGHLDIQFCMDREFVLAAPSRGLVFAYYGNDEVIEDTLLTTFSYEFEDGKGATFSAVISEETSELIAGEFNSGMATEILDAISQVTGVLPPRYLAEALLQMNLQPVTDLIARDHAPFFDAKNARVIGNQVIVLDDDASVSLTHGVKSVWQGGEEIQQNFRIYNLEEHLGPLTYSDWKGNLNLAHVIEGRVKVDIETGECVDGNSQITGVLKNQSPLNVVWIEGSERLTSEPFGTLDIQRPCDSIFKIDVSRQPNGAVTEVMVQPNVTDAYYTILKLSCVPVLSDCWWPPYTFYPTPEIIQKIWNVDSLDQFIGYSNFICRALGEPEVDSVDEIVSNAKANLTQEEWDTLFSGFWAKSSDMMTDNDGDGSICNPEEKNSKPYETSYPMWFQLMVYPTDDHPDY